MIRSYWELTKPGILFGNAITMSAGFAMASKGHFDLPLFGWTLLGLMLVVAAACTYNNCIDKQADALMRRTRTRPLPQGAVQVKEALVFGTALLMSGSFVLYFFTNALALAVALAGFFLYVFVYSFLKYRTRYGTLIGSLAGAVPPVVGYVSCTNRCDIGAGILFAMVALWQMPHFYAISIYRLADYSAASIPVLPAEKGVFTAKVHMNLFCGAFLISSLLPYLYGFAGIYYLAAACILGTSWLWICLKGFRESNEIRWARTTFLFSLVVVLGISLMIAVD